MVARNNNDGSTLAGLFTPDELSSIDGMDALGRIAQITPLQAQMKDDMRALGLGAKDQEAYLDAIGEFTEFLGRPAEMATPEDLLAYQLHLTRAGVEATAYDGCTKTLSFFFAVTCGRPEMKRYIPCYTHPQTQPLLLGIDEVADILKAAPGPGLIYRAAFSLCYGAGLTAVEICSLRIKDIDSDQMLIHVASGKGRKDRKVMLTHGLLDVLRDYWCEARPRAWLFPGQSNNKTISPGQLEQAFDAAKSLAGVRSPASLRTLAHSAATHLLQYRSAASQQDGPPRGAGPVP